jgi:hypothetical protein
MFADSEVKYFMALMMSDLLLVFKISNKLCSKVYQEVLNTLSVSNMSIILFQIMEP